MQYGTWFWREYFQILKEMHIKNLVSILSEIQEYCLILTKFWIRVMHYQIKKKKKTGPT